MKSFNRLSKENLSRLTTERLLSHYRTERSKHFKKFYTTGGESIFATGENIMYNLTTDDFEGSHYYLKKVKSMLDKREDLN